MQSICRAYAREGSPESTKRKFGLKCLWYDAGRTCETSFLTVGDLKHDPNFHFTVGECPQWKPGKMKHAAFGVGANRHICWYTDFGDYLAVGDHQLISAPGEIDWLIPDLQKVKAPGQVLGAWVKDLQKGSEHAVYKYYTIDELPAELVFSAGGIRPGTILHLLEWMPGDIAKHSTGHDFTKISAIYEYMLEGLRDRHAYVPGCNVLGHWPAHPYGEFGPGAVTASLEALKATVDWSKLMKAMDDYFWLDSASPSRLRNIDGTDGDLRPAIKGAFASAIMYYPERKAAKPEEMKIATIKLQGHIHLCFPNLCAACADGSHGVLCGWSAKIRTMFIDKNLRLTSVQGNRAIHQPK